MAEINPMAEDMKKMKHQDGLRDQISALPDDVLSLILSHLHVEESARTSALSKRWLRLWLSSPIQISDISLLKKSPVPFEDRIGRADFLISTYMRILSLHPGPIRTCHFTYDCWGYYPNTLDLILETLTLKGIQELSLVCFQLDQVDFVLPDCILSCESLFDLELGIVEFPNQLPKRIFSNLRRLKMVGTYIVGHGLSDLLNLSGLITQLDLCAFWNTLSIVVESASLKSLTMKEWQFELLDSLIIKDVPSLKCLLIQDDFTRFHQLEIVNAPKLETLNRVDMNILKIRLGGSEFARTIRPIEYKSFSTRMDSVQTLGVKVNFNHVYQGQTIPYFLSCFPCLKTLDVLIDDDGENDDYDSSLHPNYGSFWNQFEIDCFNNSLEEVELKGGYSGQRIHLDFAKFIISCAGVLKVMTIYYEPAKGKKGKRWENTQRRRLCLENRASQHATVVFVKLDQVP